jgi:histone deacetylase 11
MRWATMGTILGAREAMKTGLAINLGGGYHHASQDAGEGFCIYSDIALAVADLRQAGLLSPHQKVVYIDLDAHQGNGVCHVFFDDSRIFIFDMYNGFIYPGDTKAKRRIDCPIALPINCGENDYMRALQSKLPGFLDALARAGDVAFAIYNAGTDIVRGDTLGLMNVSESGVLKRDIFVLDQLADRKIPTLMLTSGGYTRDSFRLIAATLASLMDGTDLDLAIPPVDELKE